MAKKSALGLVTFVKTKLGMPYVYGMKGEVFTRAKYDQLHRMYPNQVTTYDLQKIGQVCADCSGLISMYTGIIRGTENFYDNSFKRLPIAQINQAVPGCALYKKGHIGVYIGNGLVIEEMGSKYGCVQKEVKNRTYTHILWLNDLDYTNAATSTPANNAGSAGPNPNNYVDAPKNIVTVKPGLVCQTISDLHLRKQPCPDPKVSESILVMPKGANVTIEEDNGWGWSKVKYKDKIGYTSNAYLNNKSLTKKRKGRSTSWTNVNIREKNTTYSNAIGKITPSNRDFYIDGYVEANGERWLQIQYGHIKGFVKYDPSYISV